MTEPTKLDLDADSILSKHHGWAQEEKEASSDSGERRQAIGQYREGLGVQAKAFSQFRAGMKIKKEGDRQDWLLSMEALLKVARTEIMGNQPDMFVEDDDAGDNVEPFPAEAADA